MVEFFSRKVYFLITFFTFFALSFGSVRAQKAVDDYMVVERLSRENGLPDQDVNGIYIDSKGFSWIGTFGGGLVRYDGDSFINFSTETDPEFAGDIVSHSHEDGFGRLWIPSSGGMNIMDMESLALLGDFPGMSKEWRLSHTPAALRADSKGCLWFTSRFMLFRVAFSDDGSRAIVDSLRCDISNADLMPKAYDVENDGSVWITLKGHLFKVRQIEGKGLQTSEIFPDIYIGDDNRATTFLRSGNDVWMGTVKGLYRIDVSSGKYVCYLHTDSDCHSLPNSEVSGLCLSPDGEVVVGTLGGVSIYNPASNSFDTFGSASDDYGEPILPGEIVRSITSRGRQIWVGLEGQGLVILQKKALKVTNISRLETTSSSILSVPARTIFVDSNDNLWLAASGFGLCRQVGDLVFRIYNTDNSSLSSNSIAAICEDGKGRIWTGSSDGYLNYINMSHPDVIRVPAGYDSDAARQIDAVLGMVYDSINDYIWIAARNGLYIYDTVSSTFTEYSEHISSCMGASIVSGRLCVSSFSGMIVVDLNTLESTVVDGFPVFLSLVPDGETVWAGTYRNGVYRIDNYMSDSPEITVIDENDGLADNQVNSLLLDGIYLWIATENGLSRLDTQTGEIASYGLNDGLKSMAFYENSISKGGDGNIYLGLKGGGLSILKPNYVSDAYGNRSDIVISGYYSKDSFHNLVFSDIINKEENDTDFTLKFSDLSYSKGSDIIYESRIIPIDKEWTPVFENDTHIKVGRIPGRNYKVQIRAVDKKGKVLSQDEKSLYVRPVLFRRWWFRLVALLLIIQLVYLLVMWYTKSINRQRDQLKQEVDRQTKILKEQKAELERKADALSRQNALLQRQNEMIAGSITLSSGNLPDRESDFSVELLEAIQKKYKDPDLNVHTLAEAMGMNRSALNERIQMVFGQSIAQFIRTYRLNVAKEMIRSGSNNDRNISEIAYEVGFNDPKYFTKCFTKEFGVTPSDLLRKSKDDFD